MAADGPLELRRPRLGSTTATLDLPVHNTSTVPLLVGTPTVGGSNAGDFAVASNGCAPAGGVAPGRSCTIGVRFTPAAAAQRSATLVIPANAPAATQVPLAGRGVAVVTPTPTPSPTATATATATPLPTIAPPASPTPGSTPAVTPTPAPSGLAASTQSGRVTVRPPWQSTFVTPGATIPDGSVVDTRAGTLLLRSPGPRAEGRISAGIFRIRQRAAAGATELVLVSPPGAERRCAGASKAHPRKGVVRKLSVAVKGVFRVIAGASSATAANAALDINRPL